MSEANPWKCGNTKYKAPKERKTECRPHIRRYIFTWYSAPKIGKKLITSSLRNDLYGYLGGIIKNLGGIALAIGGIEDHVHILAGLMATHRLDHFMRELKASSSGWVRRETNPQFSWQSGYGAFAVSAGNVDKVKSYVHNQIEHHKGKDFKTEYVELLELGRIDYDEKYLW